MSQPPQNEHSSEKLSLRIATIPQLYQNLFKRCAESHVAPRSRVKAFCQMCVGYQDVKNQVRNCTADLCPLYPIRPYQQKKSKKSVEV